MGYRYSEQDCVDAVIRAQREIEGLLTGPKYRSWSKGKEGVPSYGIVTGRFTLNGLKEKAGISTLEPGVGEGEGATISFKEQGNTMYTRCTVWNGRENQDRFYVHRLVAVAKYGFDEVVENVVHHKNQHGFDNRWENLKLMQKEEHDRVHAERQQREDGRFATV